MGAFTEAAGAAAGQAAGGILSYGLQSILQRGNDRRQLRQQDKLYGVQSKWEKDMMDYSYNKQLQNWKDTGPVGQMEQFKLAGLNPALMYEGTGAGGTTGAATTGGFGTADAPKGEAISAMGIQQGMAQMGMMQAQIENIKADTKLKEADATKTGGIDTEEAKTRIDALTQGMAESRAKTKMIDVQQDLMELDKEFSSGTLEQRIANISNEASTIMANARSAMARADIDSVTKETKIKTVGAELAGIIAGNELKRAETRLADAGVKLTDAQITNMRQSMQLAYTKLGIEGEANYQADIRNRLNESLRQLNLPAETASKIAETIIGAYIHASLMPNEKQTFTDKGNGDYEHKIETYK